MIRKHAGFILLEVLISVAVFTIGILVLINALSLVVTSNLHIRNFTLAMFAADNFFNQIASGEHPEVMADFETNNIKLTTQIRKLPITTQFERLNIEVAWEKQRDRGKTNLSAIANNLNQ